MDNLFSIKYSKFDSDIFGVDYFRVVSSDKRAIEKDLKTLQPHCIVDAKIDIDNIELDVFLQEQDFKKICTQVTLHIKNIKNIPKLDDVSIDDYLYISHKDIKQHSQNFIYNRFVLDSRLDKKLSFLVYERWITNSLQNKNIKIAHIGNDFCTFKIDANTVVLDLLSVLNKKQGIAKKLLQAVEHWSFENNINTIIVGTESENTIALGLYKKYGFIADSFISCFTLIKK